MHTLIGITSLLLIVLSGAAALTLLHRVRRWGVRRDVQLLVLAAPLVSLVLAIGALHHFAGQVCWLGAPPWDYALGMLQPLAMGLLAAGGLTLGLVRLALMGRVIGRTTWPAGDTLQALADRLAERVGAPRTRVRLCAYGRPLALASGVQRPSLLLSAWMVECLDAQELEAVLAHELAHVARRDYLFTWLAAVLRDAFFYLPTSRAAYGLLRRDNELASDDLAIAVTGRPLALASALARVWAQALRLTSSTEPAGVAIVPALLGGGGAGQSVALEHRIERLLDAPHAESSAIQPRSRAVALAMGGAALAGLLALQAANIAVLLAPMACNPRAPLVSLLGRLV